MKDQHVRVALVAAALTGALLLPTLAAAHGGPHDRGYRDDGRWVAHPYKHEKWHHRHRYDRRYRPIVIESPPPRVIYREPPRRYGGDNGLTIIYRGVFD